MAQELGAGSIVEGSVRVDQPWVRIAVELVDSRSEQTLWSEQYDRELQDVLDVQSDVALRVAEALKATLSPDERRRVEKRPTENIEAYELYLKSRKLAYSDREQNQKAIDLLRQAILMDPAFAVARGWIAYRMYWLGIFEGAKYIDEGIEVAREALRNDPGLASAHMALATLYSQQGKVGDARVSFLRALALDPNDTWSMDNLSNLEIELGHYDEALLWAVRAFHLGPVEAVKYYHVGVALLCLGDDAATQRWLDEGNRLFPGTLQITLTILDTMKGNVQNALAHARKLLEMDPKDEGAKILLCELTFVAGTHDAEDMAEQHFRNSPEISAGWWFVMESPRVRYAHLLAKRGVKERAAKLLDEALNHAEQALKDGNQSPRLLVDIAAIHCLQRENDQALSWLERAYGTGLRDYRTLALDPIFQSVCQDSRFKSLLSRMSADISEMRLRANISETLPAPLTR